MEELIEQVERGRVNRTEMNLEVTDVWKILQLCKNNTAAG